MKIIRWYFRFRKWNFGGIVWNSLDSFDPSSNFVAISWIQTDYYTPFLIQSNYTFNEYLELVRLILKLNFRARRKSRDISSNPRSGIPNNFLKPSPPSRSIPLSTRQWRDIPRNTSLSLKISNKFLPARRWWIVPILGEKKPKPNSPSKTTRVSTLVWSIDRRMDGWIMMNGIGLLRHGSMEPRWSTKPSWMQRFFIPQPLSSKVDR